MTLPIAEKVGLDGEVIALDMQPEMLRQVSEKAKEKNLPNVSPLLAELGSGKLEQNHFDRALLVTVLDEIPDQRQALSELFSALKPGGLLLISEVIFDPHFQSKKRVLQQIDEAGFRVKKGVGGRFAYTLQCEKPFKA